MVTRGLLTFLLLGAAVAELDFDFNMPDLQLPKEMDNLIRMSGKFDLPSAKEIAGLPRHGGRQPVQRGDGPHERAELPGLKEKIAAMGEMHPHALGSGVAEAKPLPSPLGAKPNIKMPALSGKGFKLDLGNMKMGLNQDQVSAYKNQMHDQLDSAKKVAV